MEYKKTLNQIKAILSIQVKLEQMKLEDGVTVVEAESFEPDYSIGIVSETGIVAMPVGEYTTADGAIIVVEQEGIIKEVKEASAEVEEASAETPEEIVAPEMEATPKKIVESVSKETFFAKEQELEVEKTKSAKLEAELNELKVQLSAAPAPLVYNPENEKKVEVNLLHSKRPETTQDRIYKKLFSKN
jgi:hypothetical protein